MRVGEHGSYGDDNSKVVGLMMKYGCIVYGAGGASTEHTFLMYKLLLLYRYVQPRSDVQHSSETFHSFLFPSTAMLKMRTELPHS